MAVNSKMAPSGARRSRALLAGASACAVGAFSASQAFVTAPAQPPMTPSAPVLQTTVSAEQNLDGAQHAHTFAFGGTALSLAAMAAAKGRHSKSKRTAKRHAKVAVHAYSHDDAKGGFPDFVNLAKEFLARPESVGPDFLGRIRVAAEEALRSGQERCHVATKELRDIVSGANAASQASLREQQRWAASALASTLMTFVTALQPANAMDQVTYSDFLSEVNKGDVEMLRVQNDLVTAQFTTKDGQRHEVNLVPNSSVEDELFSMLTAKKVDVVMQNEASQTGNPLDFLAKFAGPVAWLIAGLLLFFGGSAPGQPGGMAGPGGNPFEVGKSKAKVFKDGDIKTRFENVAGCDGAKEELVEVVDFLKNSSRYSELGAKIPKGALLVGPPGTGKTLLAKAVAGEAGVPFFSIAASEFVEIFGGAGAARVRDLFAQAKKSAPCIIFIDEIDAVGRQRNSGMGEGNDEREQTINQLLTEMDGFDSNNGVVVLAATNRADILDQALTRPGRFDRKIQVDPPDVEGRIAILKVHAADKSLAPGVDLSNVARQTPGMSGADLANLLNEAAIQAARRNKIEINMDDVANALERISIGLEKKDAVTTEKKQKLVAYHESGHAILGALMKDYDIVSKISIVPRGPAGGVTIFMPDESRLDTGLYSKEFLENRMCVALGGRIAEELINGIDNVTTGASNDFQQCTQVAQAMVMQLGMSPVVGQRAIAQQGGGNPFMGGGGQAPPTSQSLKSQIDTEVKRIVDEQYARGKFLLESNRYLMDKLAAKLIEQEKMTGEELMKMINGIAAEGKLVMQMPQMAAAAVVGEAVPQEKAKAEAVSDDFVAAAALVSRRTRPRSKLVSKSLESRLGLEVKTSPKTTGELVQECVEATALEASNMPFPEQVIRSVTAQVLATLAAFAIPLAANADVNVPTPPEQPQMQLQMQQQPQRVSGRATYSRLLEFVEEGSVQRVDFYDFGRTAIAQVKVGDRDQQLQIDTPGATSGLISKLQAKNIAIEVHTPEKPNPLLNVLGDIALPLLVVGGLLFFRSQSGGGMGGMPGNPLQSKAKVQVQPETGVKFENVAGIDEAKEELTEIVEFLKNPQRFTKVGAKIPKGVLLTGPPGTGKTLMAKALAGESGVPFIQSSASEFIELFVGVGASRVRDIFKQAKEKSPCIVFIDEIDAIGRQRGAGMGGGNDEREQTLNQILTEMDGFEGNTGVIVVAATNRSDILDNALLRPGRFDRRVQVDLPDVKGREQILKVHISNKKLDGEISLKDIAQRTAGFSGADLENLMNESAILAARRNLKAITTSEINDATDRVIGGLEGRALKDNASKRLIAYQEAGRALVGTLLPHHDPVNKVTLVPRGQSKGRAWFTPAEDQSLISHNSLRARIAGLLGARAAEQVVFGTDQVTSGAGNDLQQVERMARAMVTQLGMSDVGTLAIDDGGFMGPNYSQELAGKIDKAIREIADEGYLTAMTTISTNRAALDRLVDELLEIETLSGSRLREIVSEYAVIPEKMAAV